MWRGSTTCSKTQLLTLLFKGSPGGIVIDAMKNRLIQVAADRHAFCRKWNAAGTMLMTATMDPK